MKTKQTISTALPKFVASIYSRLNSACRDFYYNTVKILLDGKS
jgi:hypothetical protein